MNIGFANAGRRSLDSLRPIPGQPGLFVWQGRAVRRVGGTARHPTIVYAGDVAAVNPQAGLGTMLSGNAVGLLAVGVVGLVALAAYMNRDQYANPFDR